MRTTLELDDRLLATAKARARERGISLGAMVSELALNGLAADAAPGAEGATTRNGLLVLPRREGHTITDEMVADALDE